VGLSLDEMVRRYRSGASCYDLAAAAGLSRSAVAYRLRQRGIKLRPSGKGTGSGRLDLPVAEIVARYRAGQSMLTIGRALGVSAGTIHGRLVEAGVERRRRWAHRQGERP
jgi:hypothetical protein